MKPNVGRAEVIDLTIISTILTFNYVLYNSGILRRVCITCFFLSLLTLNKISISM
jgi:hypothetical protein